MGCICLPYAATLMYGALVWTHPKKEICTLWQCKCKKCWLFINYNYYNYKIKGGNVLTTMFALSIFLHVRFCVHGTCN